MAGAFSEKGAKRAQKSINRADENFRIGVMRAANQAGELLATRTKEGMRASSVPSSPGGYSGVRTAQLLTSIEYEVEGARFLRFGSRGAFNDRTHSGGSIVSTFDYAIAQHEGTKKMAARPYLTNAVTETEGQVRNMLGSVPFRKIVGGA